jgi:hypothetical protein
MAEGLPVSRTTDEALAACVPAATDARKEKLAQMLETKVAQGYQIESQRDTEAILVTRGRRRWFGLFAGRGESARQIISVDEQGRATTRKVSAEAG